MPKKQPSPQLLLLPEKAPDICEEIGLKWSGAKALFAAKLLSFNPSTSRVLTEQQSAELRFVGNLMAICPSPELLKKILISLEPPYAYSAAKIYYSWHRREWLQIPEEFSITNEIVSDYLQKLAHSGDLEELLEHKATASTAIKIAREAALTRRRS